MSVHRFLFNDYYKRFSAYLLLLFIKCNGVYQATCEYKWYTLELMKARHILITLIPATRLLLYYCRKNCSHDNSYKLINNLISLNYC